MYMVHVREVLSSLLPYIFNILNNDLPLFLRWKYQMIGWYTATRGKRRGRSTRSKLISTAMSRPTPTARSDGSIQSLSSLCHMTRPFLATGTTLSTQWGFGRLCPPKASTWNTVSFTHIQKIGFDLGLWWKKRWVFIMDQLNIFSQRGRLHQCGAVSQWGREHIPCPVSQRQFLHR